MQTEINDVESRFEQVLAIVLANADDDHARDEINELAKVARKGFRDNRSQKFLDSISRTPSDILDEVCRVVGHPYRHNLADHIAGLMDRLERTKSKLREAEDAILELQEGASGSASVAVDYFNVKGAEELARRRNRAQDIVDAAEGE